MASFSFVLDHDEVASVCDHMVVVEREGGECEGGGGEVVAVVPVEYLAPVSSLSGKINNEHRHTSRRAKFIFQLRAFFVEYGPFTCNCMIFYN